MDKKAMRHQKMLIIVLMTAFVLVSGLIIVNATTSPKFITYNFDQIEQDSGSYTSNRYTQMDDLSENPSEGARLNLESSSDGNFDELIVSNGRYDMFFNRYLNIIKIRNITTGYVWTSALDHIDNNDIKAGYQASMLSSSIGISCYFLNVTNNTYADAQYVFINKATIDFTKKDESEKPMILAPNTLDVTVTSTILNDGVKLAVNVRKYQVTLNAYFQLTRDGLSIRVPDAEITESQNPIASIVVAPAFGSTKNNEEPGYMVVPDGSGALIRYGQTSSNSQIAIKYYGTDYGLGTILTDDNLNKEKTLSAPVFGFVNGIRQDGVLGIIDSGAYNAELLISLSGTLDTKYNFMLPRYLIRQKYLLYGVNPTVEEKRNGEDIVVNYVCLSGDEATYVGMARKYQDYLEKQNVLEKTAQDFRMRLEVLMSETVPALIGTKNVTLTGLGDLNKILGGLQENDVNSLALVLKGWNSGGFSGNTPYDISFNSKVGSSNAFKTLIRNQSALGNQIFFYDDYQIAYEKGSASIRSDAARNIQRLRMSYTDTLAPLYQTYYKLYPNKSLEIAKGDIGDYEKLSINSLALDSVGDELFSYYYDGNIYHRYQAAENYRQLMAEMAGHFEVALYNPNAYMWKGLDSYFDMPMYANQFSIYTDTVPFLPYVLKGYLDYYGTSINFYANSTDQLLRLLDFGALPSYIVTGAESRSLKYTNSNQLFSTRYLDWEDSIISNYHRFEEAYRLTSGAVVSDRVVLAEGIVEVTYSNGIKFLINYTEKQYGSTNANSFSIIGGNV